MDYGYYYLTFRKEVGLQNILQSIKNLRPSWEVLERWKDAYNYLSVGVNPNLSAKIRNEFVPRNEYGHNYLMEIHIFGDDRSTDNQVLNSEIYPFLNEITASYIKKDLT